MRLFGLVLAGGKSSRMGRDKGFLKVANQTLWERGMDHLKPICEKVYLSCQREHAARISPEIPILFDHYQGIGPAAALLAAHRQEPEHNWLIFACDFPKATSEAFLQLNRFYRPEVTSFVHSDGVPEPLFAIWSAKALDRLKKNVEQGMTGPLRTLNEGPFFLVSPQQQEWLANTNTPEEWERLQCQFLKL